MAVPMACTLQHRGAPSSRGANSAWRRDLVCGASKNPLGVHALVFAGDWSEASCKKAISGAKQAGYDLIEVPLLDPSTVDVEMTASVLGEQDMAASTSLGLNTAADVNSENGELVRKGVELLCTAVDATASIGAQYMVGVLMSALHKYPGPCSADARANVISSLQIIADRAQDKGVTLGLEVVNRYETNVMNTAAGAMELLADVDRPNIVVHLDTYHMNIEEQSMEAAVQVCKSRLGYVHIGESHRGYLGTGSVDFRGLFRALNAVGYNGPITFESFSSAVVSKDLSNTLCVWRNLWDDGQDLAAHAKQFITSELHAACQGSQV